MPRVTRAGPASSGRAYVSGGFHLLPQVRVRRAPWDVAVEMRVRLGHRMRVGELQRLQQIARGGPRDGVRMAVAVVVLEPLRGFRRAPRIDVRVRELRPGRR